MNFDSTFSDYRVVVGIDFGTTYSGAAYSIISSDNEVCDIVAWPKQSAHRYPKAPTMSLYDIETKELTFWGNAARQERSKSNLTKKYLLLQQFKLYLDEGLEGVLKKPPGNLDPVVVIADYLRKFHEHVQSEMGRGYAQTLGSRYRYCLTVPAMWTDGAKKKMREAAILSGIINQDDDHDRLMLISEPEAAAIYCENTCEQFDMRDGDEFMICDAGGGTVDLIVFTVKMDANGNRRFKESTKGTGKSCGSMFIDKNMKKLLKMKLKKVVTTIPAKAMDTMMEHFIDIIKPSFDGSEDHSLQVPMNLGLVQSSNDSIGLSEGQLIFTVDELKQLVFEPVVRDVIGLIHQQKSQTKNLRAIFTVGGFGASNYLYHRIDQEFRPEEILVIKPNRPEMAVCRGAVYFGLNPNKVTTRVSRFWYGIDITNTFVDGVDPEEYRIRKSDGTYRCDHRFSTYVRRGEPINTDEPVSRNYTTLYPRHTVCTMFASSNENEPRYTKEAGVKKIFDFQIPMPELPGARDGDIIDLNIKANVELKVEASIRDISFQVICNFGA
ncbi:hypothetical protein PHYBLDRAFT_150234 [Phycomyces blakesleeanus NRRL 1555(-)]|uniref:Actin-like ATPase domain-containing protein n=1 Tax=Phycomyces blakesleeanus (strain ATCC 8743b / DSM 1359 / FGSC 10004 / NBRC 33097 / NRRL 1555) TaxID=763407 RepID=A0A167KQE5_PHYB8|nr:hypothetical protein PHYBLDRAFT_150234 [Phycomyces blakesleeanus NRRL 1555(-)]OAD68638.1 hypothetical protein PHYBLDRAFT_150234 [Phycomyces blakesleeanus NRRL 1555(-)]|eukprot:XP_018286678.1 hypothetical protein PHYBLDRAFT_150234 [Phycomyces blakesleeanus NRRL 1555(-)]